MIGETVEHPSYGKGQIVALFRNGTEWMVRFENGLRFRRPRQEFKDQHPNNGQPEPTMNATLPVPILTAAPMSQNQFASRQLLEALRVGIAPAQHIQELTIGLVEERASLTAALNRAHQTGGAVRAIVGDYGFGKSHIVELTTQEALKRNFLVATASLDLVELPAHKAFDIYGELLRHLRYPNDDERGPAPLFAAAADNPRIAQQMHELAMAAPDPLLAVLSVANGTLSARQRQGWLQWLLNGRSNEAMKKSMPRKFKLPSLYRQGNNARQIAYLLNGLSVLARLVGYSGLCLLIDEAESYSLLSAKQQIKANAFFSALIYSALQETQSLIQADQLPQHYVREFPLTYGGKQSLFFLFTVTRSDNRMPLEAWLDPALVLELDPHHSAQEIGQFMQQVLAYHAQAYGYTADDRQGQIRRGAAELLAMGMRNHNLSIRTVVRLTVELFDLLYLYPDYAAATLLDELRALVQ